jgi:hypothetical protein
VVQLKNCPVGDNTIIELKLKKLQKTTKYKNTIKVNTLKEGVRGGAVG